MDKTVVEISTELRQYIDALVEEIIFEGQSFESHKRYLRRFCEREELDYDRLEADIEAFLKEANALGASADAQQVESLLKLGRACNLSEDTLRKLIDFSSRQITRGGEKSKKPHAWPFALSGGFVLLALGFFFGVRLMAPNPIKETVVDTSFHDEQPIEEIGETVVDTSFYDEQPIEEIGMIDTKEIARLDTIAKMQSNAPTEQILRTEGEATENVHSSSATVIKPEPMALTGVEAGHEWIDLGLDSGLKWAICNVGASKPSDYGDYFAWGEVLTKKSFSWANLKYRTSGDSHSNAMFSKYNTRKDRGTVDSKRVLDMSDDAARYNWSGKWRMPTKVECEELIQSCTWRRRTMDGVNGFEGRGPNGGTIFIPMNGGRNASSKNESLGVGGSFWSSSLAIGDTRSAYIFSIGTDRDVPIIGESARRYGNGIRPVTK